MAEESKKAEDEIKKEKTIVKTVKKSANKPAKDGKEKMKFIDRIKKFFKDYKSEIKKIVWPTRKDVFQNTGVVLVAIVCVAIIVGILDLVFGLGVKGLGGIKGLFGL